MNASALRRPAATSSLFSRAEDLKLGLRVDESDHVAVGEVLAGGQPAGEMHQRRALHQGVVDVEERGGGQVDRAAGTSCEAAASCMPSIARAALASAASDSGST